MKVKAKLYHYKREIKLIKGKIVWKILDLIDDSDNYVIWEYIEEQKEDFLSDYMNDRLSCGYDD